jgi:hypothetical protein
MFMKNSLIASTLAISLTLTTVATGPAHAAEHIDLNKLIGGAIALFIIGSAIENNKSTAKKATPKAQKTRVKQGKESWDRRDARIKASRHHYELPAGCEFSIRTRPGEQDVFGKYCLEQYARLPNLLPQRCEDTVRIRHGRRADVYDAECLFARGYRVAKTRRHSKKK